MGTVFKKTFTKPLPAGAEVFERKGERFARWVDAKGKKRTAPLTVGNDGTDRIVFESGTYTAKYRDGSDVVCETATGCRDADAARAVLGDLERRSELVKAGVMTVAQDAVADHQAGPLFDHFEAFGHHLHSKEAGKVYRENTDRYLKKLAADCKWAKLPDLNRVDFERWLVQQTAAGMSARSRNAYRNALVAFCNWCVVNHRLTVNAFSTLGRANEKADPRRQRRAMTEAELMRLLTVARFRPLAEYGRERAELDETEAAESLKRSKWKKSPLTFDGIEAAAERARERLKDNPAFKSKLELLGRERALIYKTLVLTGLRKGELASLTAAKLSLEGQLPYAVLDAAAEKNGGGSTIPLRADLAADLRAWLDDRDKPTAETNPRTIPFGREIKRDAGKEAAAKPLFTVPAGLVRILDRDMKAAGIEKRDERGRTVDVHALRHSFGTLLSKGGVSPRTAQAAMRHSKLDLTMSVYTDPKLLDVAGAMDCLPSLSLTVTQPEALKATGTYDLLSSPLAPTLAPTTGKPGLSVSFPDTLTTTDHDLDEFRSIAISSYAVNAKDPLTTGVNGSIEVEARGRQLNFL